MTMKHKMDLALPKSNEASCKVFTSKNTTKI